MSVRVAGGVVVAALLVLSARPLAAQRPRAEVIGAFVEHRVTSGGPLERTFGTAFGAGVVYPLISWVELRGHLIGGGLVAQTPATDDRRFGEMSVESYILPFPWLAFTAGVVSRTYTAPLGRQRWVLLRVGSELRLPFAEDRIQGRVGGSLLPVASVSNVESPSVAAAAHTALEYRHRTLSATIRYDLQRYDFPVQDGVRRLEQLSSISASFGVAIPRW